MRGFECGEECVGGSAEDFERGVELAGGLRHAGGGGAESRKMRGFREGKMSEVAERGGERGGEAEGGPGHWSAAEAICGCLPT